MADITGSELSDIPNMEIPNLKAHLRHRCYDPSGPKDVLIVRLMKAVEVERIEAAAEAKGIDNPIHPLLNDPEVIAAKELKAVKRRAANRREAGLGEGLFWNLITKFNINGMIARNREKFEADERRLLRKEELMNEDLERTLMEIEERHSWIAFQLFERNLIRLKRAETVATIIRNENTKTAEQGLSLKMEDGLSYYRGNIVSNRRPQNAAAKHFDLTGHTAPISACKISNCLNYVLSCSADCTARLWLLKTGRCIMTYIGHSKKVNGCDLHTSFKLNMKQVCVVTCSGDCTVRLWNTTSERHVTLLQGHIEPVYKVVFNPNGGTIVSCSEDLTIRTWAFPEGFQLYVYRCHTNPIISVSYSPSGRYIETIKLSSYRVLCSVNVTDNRL